MTHNRPRIVFASHNSYLDSHNGASIAVRTFLECLARRGFPVMAVTGAVLDLQQESDPAAWMAGQGLSFEAVGGRPAGSVLPDSAYGPLHYRLCVRGVAAVIHRSPTTRPHEADEAESREFLRLFEDALESFRPQVVINFGGDALAAQVRRRAREAGAVVVFALHNFNYRSPAAFADADAVIVPSRFAASYYRKAVGLECTPLPNLVDFDRVRVEGRDPRYVTFVNPSYEKGVYAFARIADELGRLRPDIPLLVVEGRGTERTLVDCGLDLRPRGNVSVMGHTHDPRLFWGVTRICLMPSLWWENQPLVAVEAMINGVPVIGSDRGGIPEALGDAGIVLGLPARLTPQTRELPTAAEVDHWVRAVIGLWDDPAWSAEQGRRALDESRRWAPEVLEPQYLRFFEGLRPGR